MVKSKLRKEFDKLTITLLQHKYRYYILCDTTIDDFEYDYLERKWRAMGVELGYNMDRYPNWIGWPPKHPLAAKALETLDGH